MEYRGHKIFDECANEYFGEDYRDSTYCNVSTVLKATIRYISLMHFKGETPLRVKVSQISKNSGNDVASTCEPNTLNIYVNRNKDDALLTIDAEGWVALDKVPYPVSAFLSNIQGYSAKVYVNNDIKTAVIFVNKTSARWFELLTTTLPKVLTWVYPEDVRKIDKNEFELYQVLHDGNDTRFSEIIDSAYDACGVKNLWVKKKLHGWNNIGVENRINFCQQKIREYNNNIESYERQIASYLDSKAQFNQELNALMMSKGDDDDNFAHFFDTHKQLEFLNIYTNSGSKSLVFTVCETLEYYAEDELKRMLDNKNSFINTNGTPFAIKVVKALFVDKKAKMRTRACFTMNGISSLSPTKGNANLDDYSDSLRHPHLGNYDCLGANEPHIRRAMEKNDWEIALEQCIAASKNIAWGDSTVVRTFLNHIDGRRNKRCIITEDGRQLTIQEFYDEFVEAPEQPETTTPEATNE